MQRVLKKNYSLYVDYCSKRVKLCSGTLEDIDDFTTYFIDKNIHFNIEYEENIKPIIITDTMMQKMESAIKSNFRFFIAKYDKNPSKEIKINWNNILRPIRAKSPMPRFT